MNIEISGQIESNYDEVTDSFDSMSLKSELLRGMLFRQRYKTAVLIHTRCLRLWFRTPFSNPTAGDHASHQGLVLLITIMHYATI